MLRATKLATSFLSLSSTCEKKEREKYSLVTTDEWIKCTLFEMDAGRRVNIFKLIYIIALIN